MSHVAGSISSPRGAAARRRLSAWLTHPRLPIHLALVAVVLCLPALGGGWQADDYFHRVVLRGDVVSGYSQLELFSVMRHGPEVLREYIDLGLFPWWTSEELRLAFFRFLSAATHWLDYRLWPDSAVLQHAHSLLWLGALVAAATMLYRRIQDTTWVAGLAALLYAIDDAHGAPAGWLANRNALVATLFGLLCLLAHDRWRREGGARDALLAALWLSLALAAGEMGLGAVAYLLAYALVLEPPGWRRRLLSLAPGAAVVAVWAGIYRALGFGAAGSGLYVDPGAAPLAFAERLVERLPYYLSGQLTLLPAEIWILVPEQRRPVAWLVMTLALMAMIAVLAPLVARRREARFWALGALLSAVPLCGTFPSNRVLFFVGLGGAALVALWLEEFPLGTGSRPRRFLVAAIASLLVLTHLVLAAVNLPVAAMSFQRFGEPVTETVLTLPADAALGRQELVVVNAPDYLTYVSQAGSILLLNGRPMPRSIRGLAIGPSAVEARRVDERTLDLTMERGYFGGALGPLFHDSLERLAPGTAFRVPGMTATIRESTPAGTPATVRFRFDRPLESPGRRWVQFRNGRFEPFAPPVVGETSALPPALGPFDLLSAGD